MTGQYGLNKEQNDYILKILKDKEISLEPCCQDVDDDGKCTPIHRNIIIKVCDYEDEKEECDMYIQVN